MSDFKIKTGIQVRFADVDSMGHVNNAKFFTYMEQGRVAYFKHFPDLDFTQGTASEGRSIILAQIQCRFLSPARLEEDLVVGLRVREIKRSSFVMEYEITEKKTNRLVAKGESVQVYYDYRQEKSLEIPPALRKKFEELEGRSLGA